METSLRFRSDDGHLHLHAKENFVTDGNIVLQFHGRIDTHSGNPSATIQLRKKFYPEVLTNLDVGAFIDSNTKEVKYICQAKKTFELSHNGLLSLDIKGGCHFSSNSKNNELRGVVELSQKIFNFTDDQDLKLKIGYDLRFQKPYFQIRENNWTLNMDLDKDFKKPKWNIVYDL